MRIRRATPDDAPRAAAIYNAGIAEGEATFETRPRDVAEVAGWCSATLPFLVAERDGLVVGFARVTPASDRDVYAGIGEHAVYVDPAARGDGVGRALLEALAGAARDAGLHKLMSRVFATNEASLALHRAAGFREVGVQLRHGRLAGEWRDCVLVERLLEPAGAEAE